MQHLMTLGLVENAPIPSDELCVLAACDDQLIIDGETVAVYSIRPTGGHAVFSAEDNAFYRLTDLGERKIEYSIEDNWSNDDDDGYCPANYWCSDDPLDTFEGREREIERQGREDRRQANRRAAERRGRYDLKAQRLTRRRRQRRQVRDLMWVD